MSGGPPAGLSFLQGAPHQAVQQGGWPPVGGGGRRQEGGGAEGVVVSVGFFLHLIRHHHLPGQMGCQLSRAASPQLDRWGLSSIPGVGVEDDRRRKMRKDCTRKTHFPSVCDMQVG